MIIKNKIKIIKFMFSNLHNFYLYDKLLSNTYLHVLFKNQLLNKSVDIQALVKFIRIGIN